MISKRKVIVNDYVRQLSPKAAETVYIVDHTMDSLFTFEEVRKYRGRIREEILSMIKDKGSVDSHDFSREINVHIRLGDFAKADIDELRRGGGGNMSLPVSWYAYIIRMLKRYVAKGTEFNVFSDGSDDEIREVLEIEDVRRYETGNDALDLYALSKSKIMIASRSGFSLFARFLGDSGCIVFPGQKMHSVCSNMELECECDFGAEFSREMITFLRKNYI